MNTICPYCKESLSTEMCIKYKYAQFYCIDTMIYAVVPKLFSICRSCREEITYSESSFYTLQYIKVMGKFLEKIHESEKDKK